MEKLAEKVAQERNKDSNNDWPDCSKEEDDANAYKDRKNDCCVVDHNSEMIFWGKFGNWNVGEIKKTNCHV